jgi:hypothetical protein
MKFNFNIPDASLKNAIAQVDARLTAVEVRGDSVTALYEARTMLKSIWDAIEELPDDDSSKEGENVVP